MSSVPGGSTGGIPGGTPGGSTGGGTGGGSGGSGGTTVAPKPNGFFAGLPLASIKTARFLTKAGAFYSMAKIVFNNAVYEVSKTAENGAVVFEDGYQNWTFIAPDNRFDYDAMESMTLGGLLDYIINTTTEKPVPAWDEFCEWIGGVAAQLNTVMEIAHGGYIIPINVDEESDYKPIGRPVFQDITNFPTFLQNIRSAIEPAKDSPAADYRAADKAYAFGILVTQLDNDGNEAEALTLMFVFRE